VDGTMMGGCDLNARLCSMSHTGHFRKLGQLIRRVETHPGGGNALVTIDGGSVTVNCQCARVKWMSQCHVLVTIEEVWSADPES